MARTIEQILRTTLGDLLLQNADLIAKLEALSEEVERLKPKDKEPTMSKGGG